MLDEALAYNKANRDKHLARLMELVRIPSIGVLPQYDADTARCAQAFADELKNIGLNAVEIIPGNGKDEQPLVKAEWLGAPGKPTVLLYGHYDVQPPDPLDEWKTPPFEPDIRNNNIYARGSADDKGQTYILMMAVQGLLKQHGKLPVNVKFLIEGEEEVGGEHIEGYVASKPA